MLKDKLKDKLPNSRLVTGSLAAGYSGVQFEVRRAASFHVRA